MSGWAEAIAEKAFSDEGLIPETWSNRAGHVYEQHTHPYHKVLFCVSGSITFHTPDEDITLSEGERLDLPPGTPHSATVGPDGVTCMEARRG